MRLLGLLLLLPVLARPTPAAATVAIAVELHPSLRLNTDRSNVWGPGGSLHVGYGLADGLVGEVIADASTWRGNADKYAAVLAGVRFTPLPGAVVQPWVAAGVGTGWSERSGGDVSEPAFGAAFRLGTGCDVVLSQSGEVSAGAHVDWTRLASGSPDDASALGLGVHLATRF